MDLNPGQHQGKDLSRKKEISNHLKVEEYPEVKAGTGFTS